MPVVIRDLRTRELYVETAMNIDGALGVSGNVTAQGSLSVQSGTTLAGRLDVDGDTTVGRLTVGGEVAVSGSISASGNISVGSDIIASGNIGVSGHLQVEGNFRLPSSGTTLVTADGGFTVTRSSMYIEGAGGPVNVTANPQIAPGMDGDLVFIEGRSNANTVQLNNGNGLHLHHGRYIMGLHDYILMIYGNDSGEWEEISRNSPTSDESWAFRSQDLGTGSSYFAGHYLLNSGDDDFSTTATIGTADTAHGAHAFLVLGADTVDDLTITFTGTSVTDLAVRASGNTEAVVFTHPSPANSYKESILKWIGEVSIDVTSGTAKVCNYGMAKYWDNNNNNFRVIGLEATWRGGANDTDPDIKLLNHSDSGWAFHAGTTPGIPPPIASMKVDYGSEHLIKNNVDGAWKRTEMNFAVSGAITGGILVELVTGQNKAFEAGNFTLTIRPD